MILFAGSANLDFVVRAAHIPAPGETVLGHGFTTYPGGKGANQAVACAKAGGVTTQLLAALGNDEFAQPIEASLRSAGVQLKLVRVDGIATGTAFICVSDDAENAITVAPGANTQLLPSHLPDLTGISHLVMQLEIPLPTVTAYAKAAHQQGVTVVLNAAPAQTLPRDLLAVVDILIVNQGELAALTSDTGSVAQRMRDLPVPTLVTTLGTQGCCARTGERFHIQAAFKVAAVDTTGAGDTFCGVLVAALSKGHNLPDALRRASAAAAMACTVAGVQSSVPSAEVLQGFLESATPPAPDTHRALLKMCGLDHAGPKDHGSDPPPRHF